VGDGKKLRHPIYISDMVEGFEIAATHEKVSADIFIMAGPRAVSLIELADEIANVMGVKRPSLKVPKALATPGVVALEAGAKVFKIQPPFTRRSLKFYTGNTAFDISKARNVLGFNPQIDLQEGLQKTYLWLKENNRFN
jgi:nucleoside-diphosphate-sugar epimerase